MIDPLNLFFISTTIKSTPLNQFDFVVDTFSEHIDPAFHKIVPDELKPVFQCRRKQLERRHTLLPRLLTFRLSDATMVFTTSVVMMTYL